MNRAWRKPIFAAALVVFCPLARASATIAFSQQGPAPASRIVTDELGREVKIPNVINRIVTLAPNLTEIIYALGLEDRLAADTNQCDDPPAAKAKPHVGDMQNPSIEAIATLHPDLVLATTAGNWSSTADALEHVGVPVYTTDPHTVRGMLDSIVHISDVIGEGTAGAALVARLQARLDTVRARLAERPLVHVLFVVWEDPLITVGQNTFIADALRWAGAESVIVSRQNYPRVSLEEIVRLEPEYIVLTSDHESAEGREAAALREREGWKQLLAVKEGHVVVASDGIDRPSPSLIDAIETLARELHPDAFAGKRETRNTKSEAGRGWESAGGSETRQFACAR